MGVLVGEERLCRLMVESHEAETRISEEESFWLVDFLW